MATNNNSINEVLSAIIKAEDLITDKLSSYAQNVNPSVTGTLSVEGDIITRTEISGSRFWSTTLNKYIDEISGEISGKFLETSNPSGVGTLTIDNIKVKNGIEGYYKSTEVDDKITTLSSKIPSKTSQLTNDSGFLTEHQSLDNYYTKTEADNTFAKKGEGLSGDFLSAVNPTGTGTLKIDNISLTSMVHSKTSADYEIGLYLDNTSTLVYGTLEDVSMRTEAGGTIKPNILNVNYGIGNKISGLASFVAGNTNVVQGNYAVALNASTSALNNSTLAHGEATQATGNKSHAEGSKTRAIGEGAHAEGSATSAVGSMSHAEGTQTKALAERAHAEGYLTVASGIGAHAEGTTTSAAGPYTHTEGFFTYAKGEGAHAEGYQTSAFNKYGHAEGINTIASGTGGSYQTDWQHVIGKFNEVKLGKPFIIGGGTSNTTRKNIYEIDWNGNSLNAGSVTASAFFLADGSEIKPGISGNFLSATNPSGSGNFTFTGNISANTFYTNNGINKIDKNIVIYTCEGAKENSQIDENAEHNVIILGERSTVAGKNNIVICDCNTSISQDTKYSIIQSWGGTASGNFIQVQGQDCSVTKDYAHAEGNGTHAYGEASHAEGNGTYTNGNYSHAEGNGTYTNGNYSHAEGNETHAAGDASHAEGGGTYANGINSHAEGGSTNANSFCSHAEGFGTTANGINSHAEGIGTIANNTEQNYPQHVEGKYNIEDSSNIYQHIVGGGIDDNNRANIQTLDWSGNLWTSGVIDSAENTIHNLSNASSYIISTPGIYTYTTTDSAVQFELVPPTDTTHSHVIRLQIKMGTVCPITLFSTAGIHYIDNEEIQFNISGSIYFIDAEYNSLLGKFRVSLEEDPVKY